MLRFCILYFAAYIKGFILWRLRGEDLKLSTFTNRFLFWILPVAADIVYASNNWLYGLLATPLVYFGVATGYHSQFDLSIKTNRSFTNLFGLAMRGAFTFAPLVVASYFIDIQLAQTLFWSVVIGFSMPLWYWIGLFCVDLPKFPLLYSASCWGEALYGGAIFSVFTTGLYHYYGL